MTHAVINAQMYGPGSTWGACGGFPTHTPAHVAQACRDGRPRGFRPLSELSSPVNSGGFGSPFFPIQFAGVGALGLHLKASMLSNPLAGAGCDVDRQPIHSLRGGSSPDLREGGRLSLRLTATPSQGRGAPE